MDPVGEILKSYARRGVFRSYSERGGRYRFVWLTAEPFDVAFDPARDSLTFVNLLPAVSRELSDGLKDFIRSCTSPDLPDHRRIDVSRLRVIYRRKRGVVSIEFLIQNHNYEYGVRKAVNIVNEIFLSFLTVHHAPYMVEHFQMWDE